jgi:putative nucleotidyltransferase with HDIG domain
MVTSLAALPWLPQPPDWHLDWDAIVAACPWLLPLAATPQDPSYHAEGDVLTHTGMVVEALAQLVDWRSLPAEARAELFAAALLHDIGKPECTRFEAGSITSRGHARAGAPIARQLLWSTEGFGAAIPFAARERVVALVRLHGLPIWFLDRPDLDRAILGASMRVRLDEVALLAEADARGRRCSSRADQDELLARIMLFREQCAAHGCLAEPFPFPSDHSRVRYFRGLQQDPRYQAYDQSWGEVVVLAGLPGVGKDTWVRANLPGVPCIALDAIRAELDVDPADGQGAVVAAARERARTLLRQKQRFVWNATNLTRQIRDPLIDLLLAYGARVQIVYLDAPLDVVLRRNRHRAAPVPETVIRRLATKIEPPDLTESHRVDLIDASVGVSD